MRCQWIDNIQIYHLVPKKVIYGQWFGCSQALKMMAPSNCCTPSFLSDTSIISSSLSFFYSQYPWFSILALKYEASVLKNQNMTTFHYSTIKIKCKDELWFVSWWQIKTRKLEWFLHEHNKGIMSNRVFRNFRQHGNQSFLAQLYSLITRRTLE